MRMDRNETSPITRGAAYDAAVAAANSAREQFEASLRGVDVPCVNCMLPVPPTIWPCCGGVLNTSVMGGSCGAASAMLDLLSGKQLGSSSLFKSLPRLMDGCGAGGSGEPTKLQADDNPHNRHIRRTPSALGAMPAMPSQEHCRCDRCGSGGGGGAAGGRATGGSGDSREVPTSCADGWK